jgi:hypothetical protein
MAGITSRANSALCRIEYIHGMGHLPPAVRLALIAEVIAHEPILTDTCPAAYTVRELAWPAQGSAPRVHWDGRLGR